MLDRNRKGFRELGLDVAIDKRGRFWILEVNTRPQFYPLKHMWNKQLYQRIGDILPPPTLTLRGEGFLGRAG
jgi:hypothetical protein